MYINRENILRVRDSILLNPAYFNQAKPGNSAGDGCGCVAAFCRWESGKKGLSLLGENSIRDYFGVPTDVATVIFGSWPGDLSPEVAAARLTVLANCLTIAEVYNLADNWEDNDCW